MAREELEERHSVLPFTFRTIEKAQAALLFLGFVGAILITMLWQPHQRNASIHTTRMAKYRVYFSTREMSSRGPLATRDIRLDRAAASFDS